MLSKTKYTIQNSIHLLIIITLKYVCKWIKKFLKKLKTVVLRLWTCKIFMKLFLYHILRELVPQTQLGQEEPTMEAQAKTAAVPIPGTSVPQRISFHKELGCGQISLPPQGRCPWLPHCKDFPVSPQSPHSSLRKKAQLPDRVTTDVQALSHSVAVIFHSQSMCRI